MRCRLQRRAFSERYLMPAPATHSTAPDPSLSRAGSATYMSTSHFSRSQTTLIHTRAQLRAHPQHKHTCTRPAGPARLYFCVVCGQERGVHATRPPMVCVSVLLQNVCESECERDCMYVCMYVCVVCVCQNQLCNHLLPPWRWLKRKHTYDMEHVQARPLKVR